MGTTIPACIAVSIGQRNAGPLMSFECLLRLMLRLQIAIARHSENPSWRGLGETLSKSITTSGAIEVSDFTQRLAGGQNDEELVLRQARFYREEQG